MNTRVVLTLMACAIVSGGCSATRFDYQTCAKSSECQSAFGFGSACGSSGFCEMVKPIARCARTIPADLFSRPERYKNPVVIGSLMDRSSAAHVVRENAVALAVKQATQAGGYDGRPVAAVLCDIAEKSEYDSATRAEAPVTAANFLADKLGVVVLVGPPGSGDAQQVWTAMRSKGTVVISPAATSPSLQSLEPASSDEKPGLLWRVAPPDSLQGVVIADDMQERQVSEVVVIAENDPYGEGLSKVVYERFTGKGGKVTLRTITGDTQIGPAAADVAAMGASEVLFISAKQDWVIKFLNAAGGQAGFQNKNIFLTDAAANQSVLTGAAAASSLFPRVRGTRPAPRSKSDLVFASFVAGYSAEYAGADPTSATYSQHSYDAAWLAFYGAAWSMLRENGVLSGIGVARGLRRVSSGGNPTEIKQSSWATVVSSFRMGAAVNVSGASGELDFEAASRNVTTPIQIWSIDTMSGQATIANVAIKNPE